jgi:hypothetical protein
MDNMSETLGEIRKGVDKTNLILTEAIKSNKAALSAVVSHSKK